MKQRMDPMEERERLVLDAAERARRYLHSINERATAPDALAVAELGRLQGKLPEHPTSAFHVLDMLDTYGSPATVANAGGRYFGYVNGGATPGSLAAHLLAAAWDQNGAMRVMSPVAAVLEETALEWIRELLALPVGIAGGLVSGATLANLSCLAAARHALLARAGWDVESQGLFGAPPFQVIMSEETHISVRKALSLLGLGRDRIVQVPTDSQGRMRSDLLPRITEPTLICVQAGNVNTGAFDPVGEIYDAVPQDLTWIHVDGAFGLWAAASPDHAHLLAGHTLADSWATDGHKWLNLPYDCGILFVRDEESLYRSMSMHAAYLPASNEREPLHWTPEMSRRARGVEAWATVQEMGRSGIAELVRRTCGHARRFADALQNAGYEILNEVVINQVLVSFGSNEVTRSVISAIQEDGVCWCGGTTWKGRDAMRISVSSWATTDEDVTRSIASMLRMAEVTIAESETTIA